MKIKKSLVEQIIREESEKIKKLIILKEEKKRIIKQLNELYEEDEQMDEIFGFGKNQLSPEEALQKIMQHTAKRNIYQKLQTNPDAQQKYVNFVAKNPNVDYIKWDKAIGDFVDASVYSDATGMLGTRKFEEGEEK